MMPQKPVDVDVKQSIKDMFFATNKYKLVDQFVIRDGKKHPFAILVPGGGYQIVSNFIEGGPIARKLNEQGISAFVVYYRVKKNAKYPAPMDDLATAVKYIFDHAEEYSLDTANYSIWGASAGGHLAASFGTENMGYAKYNLPKPGTLVLAYPVITMEREKTHMGSHDMLLGKNADKEMEAFTSVEQHVTATYPRTFIWCSDDDAVVNPDNTRDMVAALEKAGVAVQSTIYHGVQHGAGPATGTVAENWMNEAVSFWLSK
ncbi:MAG: alpha/beta hydrolase [Eubacteriales bacterium]|jgi:acetyl esterase/lipase